MLRPVRVKVLLVIEDGDVSKALTTDLLIHATTRPDQFRIRFRNAETFHTGLRRHVRQVILPIVDQICSYLQLKRRNFEISVVNINLATSMGKTIQVSGFSADAPIFCGMLAAATHLAIPANVVMTGHIASHEGDIRMVRHLVEKCRAAFLNPEIEHFIHPDTSGDDSFANILNDERLRLESKIRGSRSRLRVSSVSDILDLVRLVFENRTGLLKSGLKSGYFERRVDKSSKTSDCSRAVSRLLQEPSTDDFFDELKLLLLQSRNDAAKGLLQEYLAFFLRRKKYPFGIGANLQRALMSLPPSIHRLKIQFPLVSKDIDRRLQKIARHEHERDAKVFSDTTSGLIPTCLSKRRLSRSRKRFKPSSQRPRDPDAEIALDYLLKRIEETSLVSHIDKKLDQARASYRIDTSVIKNESQFIEAITAFWLHCGTPKPIDPGLVEHSAAKAEAIEMLHQAYARHGGYAAAYSEARNGIHGGLLCVFDVLIQELKIQKRRAYVRYHFRKAVDQSDPRAQVALMNTLMHRFPNSVPKELRRKPPEHFVKKSEEILISLSESMNLVKRLTSTR